jgi:hypothetical protein
VISPEKRVEFRHSLQIPVRFRCFEKDCMDLEVLFKQSTFPALVFS